MRDGKLCLNGCFKFKPRSEFGKHPRSPDGLASRCKSCERERLQIRKHGMTSAQKAAVAEAQGGCAICQRIDPGRKGWVVDHDRSCCPTDVSCERCRRGVLCHWCNSALGYAGDSSSVLRAMAEYIESNRRLTDRLSDSVKGLGSCR